MSSDSSSSFELKGLQMKQDDKFFSRLMSKETSMANSSSRVYYGGASVAVPFMWESHPGTSKHPASHTALPPLTPPPSYPYHSSLDSKSNHKNSSKPTLFASIFPCLNCASPSLHASSSSPFANPSMNRKLIERRWSY
ncbi:uncharacterized protein LOC120161492 [Hibiscus syriacus]|uniref:uncharacterized protein LOC120161492 n=1 Tax=Hibiscus syriacus TaxID=106335 RepID=UPI0019238986|nr:uncharacterized protein LOC120161492 [Hibiscus syriacus]